jgi:hypothetical protein
MQSMPLEPQWDTQTKIDVLKHAQSIQLEEIRHRRSREYQIFSWTSGLLVALIGALLVFPRTPQAIWTAYGVAGKLLASLAIVIFAVHSINWQIRNRQAGKENAQVVVRINHLLHLFEQGYYDVSTQNPILPAYWQRWGDSALMTGKTSLWSKLAAGLLGANFISPTFLLTIVAVIMIWFS